MSRYGKTYESDVRVEHFKAGINEDVRLVRFGLVEVNTDKYQGNVLDVEWQKKDSVKRARVFPVNEEQVTPREVGGEMQTMDEAIDKAYADVKNWIKHVVTGYDHYLPEDKQGTFDQVTSTAGSFEELVNAAKSLLPANTPSISGELIVGYDKGGFLNVPGAMWVTGHFWKPEGSDKVLQVRTKDTKPKGYLMLTPPVQAPDEPAQTPQSDTSW